MARGQRRPAEEQLMEVESKIAKHKEAIRSLEERRTELLKLRREEECNMLFSFMQTNNISIGDVMNMLQAQ